MSFFTIKHVFDSPSWARYGFDSIPKSSLNYSRYSDQTLIYCNHPESVGSSYLGDNGYCINKVTVSTASALLYASCNSLVSTPTNFAVRVYNPNNTVVRVTKKNSGFYSSNDWHPQTTAYEHYFYPVTIMHDINPGQSKWIESFDVASFARFEAIINYALTGSLVFAVYLCQSLSSVGTSPQLVPVSQNEYSGYAAASYISTQNTLRSSDLFVSYYNSAFYGITKKNFSGNASEHNPITLAQGGIIASEDSSTYNNIGNYGLQYAFSTTLKNTETTRSVRFRGYVISNPNSHCAGISSGGVAKAYFLGPYGEGISGNHIRWMFCETDILTPGQSITLDYQYMHLGRGNAPGIIQWEAVLC